MTNEEIQGYLKESNLEWIQDSVNIEAIQHFVELIEEHEKQRIIKICEEMINDGEQTISFIRKIAKILRMDQVQQIEDINIVNQTMKVISLIIQKIKKEEGEAIVPG